MNIFRPPVTAGLAQSSSLLTWKHLMEAITALLFGGLMPKLSVPLNMVATAEAWVLLEDAARSTVSIIGFICSRFRQLAHRCDYSDGDPGSWKFSTSHKRNLFFQRCNWYWLKPLVESSCDTNSLRWHL